MSRLPGPHVTIGMPSVIRRMVPSVEPGTPPNRARLSRGLPHTADHGAHERLAALDPWSPGESRSRPAIRPCAPGTASIARWQAMSISLAHRVPSGPGVSRTSSVAWALDGMTLDCATPCTGRTARWWASPSAGGGAAARAEPPQPSLERGHLAQQSAERADRVHAGLGHRAVRHAPVRGHARPHHAALLEAQLVLLGLADDGGVSSRPIARRAQVLGRRSCRLPRRRARRRRGGRRGARHCA